MLKQFQYTSIALLCSMAVACSSGGKGGQKPSPNQNPPRAEQPQPQPQPQAPRQEAQPDQAVPPKTDLAPNAPQQNGQADQPKAESESQKDQQAGQEMPPKVTEPAPSQPTPPAEQPNPMEPAVFTVTVQDIQVSDHDIEATKEHYKNGIEKLVVTDGKLNLSNPKRTLTVKDVKGSVIDDVGLSLLSADSTSTAQGFSKVKEFGNIQRLESFLSVRDMDVNQWKYQTFGNYFEHATGANGFVSFGEESKTIPSAGTAKYSGIALGTALENNRPVDGLIQIASEVGISADFDKKSLTFETSNTKGFKIDGEFVDPSTRILDYGAWDLKGAATWNAEQKAFEGKVQLKTGSPSEQSLLKGSFYGPNAAEIGGTFHLKDANKDYRGAFGGKKEEAPAVQGK